MSDRQPSEAIPATPRNMFGLLPCPKCASPFRWPDKKGVVHCDDCWFTEPLPDDLRSEYEPAD